MPRRARPDFLFSSSSLLCNGSNLLPGAVVARAFESRPGLDQSPPQGPLIGVIEALAGVGLRRGVQNAGDLEVPGIDEPAGFLDQVAGMPPRILVDRFGRAGFRPEHRGERKAVEPLSPR